MRTGILVAGMGLWALGGSPQELGAVEQSVQTSSRYIWVDGDAGRFREDRFATDQATGGIEGYHLSAAKGDIQAGLDLHALYDYDYGLTGGVHSDRWSLTIDGRQTRRYYDGSNEPWDPTRYSLSRDFADWDDDELFTDRADWTVEGALRDPGWPGLVLGWHHWERDGRETRLSGERARITNDTLARLRSIPFQADVNGRSETFYAQLSHLLCERMNFTGRQEYERYQDKQFVRTARYNNGTVEQNRFYQDSPEFREYRTRLSLDGFIREALFVSANYLYHDLRNESRRDERRPAAANNQFVNNSVKNTRRGHTGAFGAAVTPLNDLQLRSNFRIEYADTEAVTAGMASGTTLRVGRTGLDELRTGELIGLTYSGLPKTRVSLEAEWEQRALDVFENEDTRSHELFTDFSGPPLLSREAEIHFNNAKVTAHAAHQLSSRVRLTGRYRFQRRDRNYMEQEDNSPTFYPGYLGSQDQDVHQWTLRVDGKPCQRVHAGLEYQHEQNNLKFARQTTDGQDLTLDRVSANVTLVPMDPLTVFLTGMVEDYQLDTPGAPSGSRFESGEKRYDYTSTHYVTALTGAYTLSDRTTLRGTVQHTEANGSVNNQLDELRLGLSTRLGEDHTLQCDYEFFDFDDEGGSGFDSYDGHGFSVAYEKKF